MKSKLSNLYIGQSGHTLDYIPISNLGGKGNFPPRDNRRTHAERLEKSLKIAWDQAEKNKRNQQ